MSAIQLNKKGYCVSNLMNMSGRTGTEIAARVEGMDKNLDMYLKELRERQIESGGTGRVVVFVNYGINSDTSPTVSLAYTNAADRIKTRIQARWVATGGNIANLAFIFAPSHPVPAASVTPWDTNRATVVTSAISWAIANQNDNSGTCVVDGGIQYTSTKLTIGVAPSGTMYDGGGQSHLNATTTSGSNGYDAFAGAIFSSLMSA
jgi:ankyrin repeat protein